MANLPDKFSQWLAQAHLAEHTLTALQRPLLQAAFAFLQRTGDDYYSCRLLSHFLLHCASQLKVAQIARLVGVHRSTASRQQNRSSKQVIQSAHHRLDGRPYGKLLPRYAGPIAHFILTHTEATRHDILNFIDHTFGIRVSTVALHYFLKKYGLDSASRAPLSANVSTTPKATVSALEARCPEVPATGLPSTVETIAPGQALPAPAPPFSPLGPSMPEPSC